MYKSIISAVAALAVVVLTIPAFAAISSDTVPASNAWHYDGYSVERLSFDGVGVDGPVSIGEHVVIAVSTGDTDVRDLYFLSNGGYIKVEDVPVDVISEDAYNANEGRFVWAESTDSGLYNYDLIELDPATGEKITLQGDLHFNGAESVDAHVSGDTYYFTANLNFNGSETTQSAEVYWYDPLERDVMIIDWFNDRQYEEVLDAHDGLLLTKMVFEGGEKQLWIYEGKTAWAIYDSWTVAHEEIESAHFMSDGRIEFFRQYERNVHDVESNTTEAMGEYLNWEETTAYTVQVVDRNMAWLDADRNLHLSTVNGSVELGEIGSTGIFRLEADRLFYDLDGTGMIYDLATGQESEMDFIATDVINGVIVGTNAATDIIYFNEDLDLTQVVGFGGQPLVSDTQHIYWMGADENIYQATIDTELLNGELTSSAVKLSDSNTVYLIEGKSIYTFPNEKVFYSYFDSFDVIDTVTQAKLSEYTDAGEAYFAAGTRVKLENDPKVYTVGYDGKLHWIISQALAYDIYGGDWNQGIIEINLMDLVDYSFGTNIENMSDAEII